MITRIKRIIFILIVLGIIYGIYWLIDRPGADKLREDAINTTQGITENFGLNPKDVEKIFAESATNEPTKVDPEPLTPDFPTGDIKDKDGKTTIEEVKNTEETKAEEEKKEENKTEKVEEKKTETKKKTTTNSSNNNILFQLFK